MKLNWIPLPHCPNDQLQEIGNSLDNAGWDIRTAENYIALSYKDIEINKLYTLEPICLVSEFQYHSSLNNFELCVGNIKWIYSKYKEGLIKEEDMKLLNELYSKPNNKNIDFLFRKKHKFNPCKTGIILRPQTSMWNGVFLRSGFSIKYGLGLHNNVGVIDYSYRGSSDELLLALYSRTDVSIPIQKGERVCQLIRFKQEPYELNKLPYTSLKDIKNENRGAFGSTGNK